jgi:hypothetical protein
MRLEWDARKARQNFRKHGISFEEASSVFFDPLKGETPFASSAHAGLPGQKGNSMKKARKPAKDELRSEYKRSDFGDLLRGKYVERLREESNVVVLDPKVAEFFPNSASVNSALSSLAEIAKRSARRGRSRGRR